MRRVRATAKLIVAAAVWLATAAATPVNDHINLRFSFVSPNFCRTGEAVEIHTHVVQSFRTRSEPGAWISVQFEQTFVRAATGETSTFRFAHLLTSTFTGEAPDGTLSFYDTLQGLTGQLRTSDGAVLRWMPAWSRCRTRPTVTSTS
jgi:hypothetical protein